MRCRDWLSIAFGGVALVWFALPSHAQDSSKQNGSAAATEQNAQSAHESLPMWIRAPLIFDWEKEVEPDWNNPKCGQTQSHDEADLCEQIRMAEAAKRTVYLNEWQLWVGLAGAAFLIITIFYSRKAAIGALAAAEAAEATLVVSQRPWVRISRIHANAASLDGRGFNVDFSFRVENVGRSPATRVRIVTEAIYLPTDRLPPFEIRDAQRELYESARADLFKSGLVVFPRDPMVLTGFGRIPREVIDFDRKRFGSHRNPFIAVCVAYDFVFDNRTYVTSKVFRLDCTETMLVNFDISSDKEYESFNAFELDTHDFAD